MRRSGPRLFWLATVALFLVGFGAGSHVRLRAAIEENVADELELEEAAQQDDDGGGGGGGEGGGEASVCSTCVP